MGPSRSALLAFLLGGLCLSSLGCTSPRPDYGYPLDDVLRLNQLQVKGTHNSYHVAPDRPVVPEHGYTHPALDVQLSQYGVRQFELDLHYDPDQGYLVFHLPILDDRSTCRRFVECLQVLKRWSDTHPGHHPLFIWLEPKDILDRTPITDYDALDAEIRSVWPEDRLLTPDRVQGGWGTLREAVQAGGWPTLGEVRDQAMFMLLDTGEHQRGYSAQGTSLRGRVAFVDVDDLGSPLSAVKKINDPTDKAAIEAALRQGLIVGSNVDGVTGSDAENEARLRAGLANGAHLLSSDWLAPGEGRGYALRIPEGTPSRCNPGTAPPGCTASAVEDLARVQAQRAPLRPQPR
jgi:hypothetical protein